MVDFELNSCVKGGGTLGVCFPRWGEAPSILDFGQHINKGSNYPLFVSFFAGHCALVCVYLNSARVTVMF